MGALPAETRGYIENILAFILQNNGGVPKTPTASTASPNDKLRGDKNRNAIYTSTPSQQIEVQKVAQIKPVVYDVPEIKVAQSIKPVRLDKQGQGKSEIPTTVLASQNVSDRLLAHVASGGIGWDYRA